MVIGLGCLVWDIGIRFLVWKFWISRMGWEGCCHETLGHKTEGRWCARRMAHGMLVLRFISIEQSGRIRMRPLIRARPRIVTQRPCLSQAFDYVRLYSTRHSEQSAAQHSVTSRSLRLPRLAVFPQACNFFVDLSLRPA